MKLDGFDNLIQIVGHRDGAVGELGAADATAAEYAIEFVLIRPGPSHKTPVLAAVPLRWTESPTMITCCRKPGSVLDFGRTEVESLS